MPPSFLFPHSTQRGPAAHGAVDKSEQESLLAACEALAASDAGVDRARAVALLDGLMPPAASEVGAHVAAS